MPVLLAQGNVSREASFMLRCLVAVAMPGLASALPAAVRELCAERDLGPLVPLGIAPMALAAHPASGRG
jgi:hypothetical protein